jgi:cyclopropane-fatty-acyl-phospholipid synthase
VDAAAAVRRVHQQLHDLAGVALPVRLWDGTELGPDDAGFRVVLHHPWSVRALLLPPSDLAAGEAYVHGDIDVEGDMIAALAAGTRFRELPLAPPARIRLLRSLLTLPRPPRRDTSRRAHLRGRRHSRARDRQAIAFHYDLPHAFYRCFLDDQLVYSCAYFAAGEDDLERAQVRKLDLVCRKLRLRRGSTFLDIGCGWGSLLLHAARHYDVTGVGVTLSQTQFEAAKQRVADAGLADQVEVRLQDYRDIDGAFDAVASVGMVEHVGPDGLAGYFDTAYQLTRPGGLCLTHSITTGDADRVLSGRERGFLATYVFPDGGLAPVWRLVREAQRSRFELLDVEQLRPHYARTLRHWVGRLESNREAAVAAAGEMDYRIWRCYMAGSAVGFETRYLGVVQILAGRDAEPPPGRAWMLPQLPAGQAAT